MLAQRLTAKQARGRLLAQERGAAQDGSPQRPSEAEWSPPLARGRRRQRRALQRSAAAPSLLPPSLRVEWLPFSREVAWARSIVSRSSHGVGLWSWSGWSPAGFSSSTDGSASFTTRSS